jgi:UDP:flavonoid glycosyltransferase YjiC (YdhE family)
LLSVIEKINNVSEKVQNAIKELLADEEVKRKAKEFSVIVEKYNGPQKAAEILYNKYK